MKTRFVILLSIISCFFSSPVFGDYAVKPKNANELKVAVYDNGVETKDFAINYIYDAMKAAAGVKAELIDNLAADTLKNYDAVIIATLTKLAKNDIADNDRNIRGNDWVKTLTNYVDAGGGLVLCHNAIGYRGIFMSYNLFPMIGSSSSRNMETTFTVNKSEHPIMSGIGATFVHGYDHMEINPGKDGQILAVDKKGNAVIVAGDVSRGRVVQIGFPPGIYWKSITKNDTNTMALNKTDTDILLNAVRWAGAKPRYDVPVRDTETGLLAETMNFKKQQEEAAIAKYKDLPMPRFDEAAIWLPGRWIGPGAEIDSREKVAGIMDNCKKMGFNKVVIIMKHGPAYYPSELKLDSISDKESYYGDCAVQEARKRGMKAALVFSPFTNGPKDGKSFPYDVNKTEYDKIQQGKMKLSDVGAKDKHWSIKNCPDHPAVRQRALDVTAELIKKYHPDEMYLDYIRYKDGYETSCYCDYSQKSKAEFAAKHPEIKKDRLDEEFAKSSLIAFVKEWTELCKKLDPEIKTSCYTMSTARNKSASEWVNAYPLDWHAKYVSRKATGPESSFDDTVSLAKSYSKWLESGKNGTALSPIISAYDPKTGERLFTEFKIVSDLQDKAHVKFKRVEYWDYSQLLEVPKKDLKISDDMAGGISRALSGSWNK